jgi:hypothetical protein
VSVDELDIVWRLALASLEVHGPGSVAAIGCELGEIGVLSVAAGDVNEMFD